VPVVSLDRVSGEGFGQKQTLTMFKLKVDFIPTPERNKRLLFDQFHSLKYPQNGFIFKDNLGPLDHDNSFANTLYEWHGDHLFTNYQGLHARLSSLGYHMEILT
jgi:membrane-bound transcription factor site-1 protease